MQFIGMLRVKNEARWIERVVHSLEPLCERIFVFDDHSTDGTPELCEALGCTVYRSEFDSLNEIRDKNALYQKVWAAVMPNAGPESQTWAIAIDGDEELEPDGPRKIRAACQRPGVHALALPIVYLWNSPEQIRTDGVYGKFARIGRGSVFRMISPFYAFGRKVHRGREQANFHCGSIPWDLMGQVQSCNARLLHYGYMEKADRLRKFDWYRQNDPENKAEDNYRHMVQGDIPEVPARFRQGIELMHAGPLQLEPLVL